jgi:hypothetical protein
MIEYVCECIKGKIPYISRQQGADALRTMKRISSSGFGVNRLNLYKCGRFWHIGHRPNKKFQRLLRKKGLR